MAHMAKVEVVMDEKALFARRMLNFKLVKLSWALFFILIGGSWILESLKKIDKHRKMGNHLCRMRCNPSFVEPAAGRLEDQYQ
ncbi:MAG: hypothetical protein MPEBLZ_03591 [Candidatus Methanoperedens nitroreducens]|uniref:Uncharacterized protein n=1 Tax=Candidatus Methanoperedens nitratireducens TaxID=1392998 RepID=A0A0P8A1I1_9EURY|nr:MAG: hypothetical protein MPEBLZ_03591 [Candidatus Methanoperedens sp. BLZ1]